MVHHNQDTHKISSGHLAPLSPGEAKLYKISRRRTKIGGRKPAVLGKSYTAYLYILPVFVFLSVFTYYALFFNIDTSLYRWNGVSAERDFLGLNNYVKLFGDPYFRTALSNTLIYFLITIPVQAVIGFLLAYSFQKKFLFRGLTRSFVFLPNILALVVIGHVFNQMYNFQTGFLNNLLRSLGLASLARDWTGDPSMALYAVILANIYTYVGFSMTIYLAGIIGIPKEVHESATIDGANNWHVIRYIDIPLLISSHITITILGVVGTLKTFDIVWLITRGGPARSSEMLATFLYRSYILEYKAGYAAAVAVIILIIALGLAILNLNVQRRHKIEM